MEKFYKEQKHHKILNSLTQLALASLMFVQSIQELIVKEVSQLTNNQINYARLREDQRHNVVSERIGQHQAGSSRIQAITGLMNWQEQSRHNRAGEELSKSQLRESIRHNVADENLNIQRLDEQRRASQAQEAETNRSNVARELENTRHNTETEAIQRYSAVENVRIGELNARANQAQAAAATRQAGASELRAEADASKSYADIALNQQRQRETERYNLYQQSLTKAQQDEAKRHNLASEKETYRSRMDKYALGLADLDMEKASQNIKRAEVLGNLAKSIVGLGR